MEKLLQWMEYIEDVRQEKKVRHKLKDILVIVMFATLADADDWVEIAEFAEVYEDYLKKYISLENGVPSHDTIQRVMGMVSPEALQQLYIKWQGLLDSGEGEALKKIVCIDGKTMRGNKNKGEKPLHIVSAWSKEDGFCMGQRAVMEKSNEMLDAIGRAGGYTYSIQTQDGFIWYECSQRLVEYLVKNYGMEKTMQLIREGKDETDYQTYLGISYGELKEAWIAFVKNYEPEYTMEEYRKMTEAFFAQ